MTDVVQYIRRRPSENLSDECTIQTTKYNASVWCGPLIAEKGLDPRMDKFLSDYKRKVDNNEDTDAYTSLEKPMCLLCSKVLASHSMRPVKLKRHLETLHSEYVEKPIEFFQRKLDEINIQKQTLKKILSVTPNALLASYHVSYRIAKCEKAHIIGQTLLLPAAVDMVRIMFGESYTKQL
ncbi:protein FAM200B-like [Arctopsyche grandis]|uniref:protein FAM200B-like n=1 Tax=Arctopsyche grandis TaxID=121162 RepID=UPI00406D8D67